MSIYKHFCVEQLDKTGTLTGISFHYPDNFNFGYDVVDAIAMESPEKRAMVWCNTEGEERTFTFGDIRRLSDRTANVLRSADVKRGDHVMVCLKKHFEFWYVSIALHKLGAVMVPVTHMLTVKDLLYRMDCIAVKAIICTPQNGVPANMRTAAEEKAPECALFTVQEDVPGFQNLTKAVEAASEDLPRQETCVTDPMLLYFTSGTTGYPKGVIHDFSYPLAHVVTAKYWQQAEDGGLHFTVAETGWAKSSWGKLYGQWLIGSAVMVFDFDNFDPKQLCTVINQYGVTSFCAPPTVYRYLTRKGIPEMPTLRHAVTAGEQLNPEVSRRFTQRTGLPLMEGYGQTETTVLLANFRGSENVVGSLGRPSPQYRVELRTSDGAMAPVGEIGEIVVVPKDGKRPIGIFSAYLNDPERYENAWRGGVYHTGDSAWQDADGNFWFHGRFDDLIKTGGFRVGPYEVENVLHEHPAVLECAVVGIPDEARGQAIKAFVVLNQGYAAGKDMEKELREFSNARMAEYKWIRVIEFVDTIPKTISGKICKAALRR
ncbi:MAG: AMP-binding protein [Oscillospiraceae bacterium]|nr:AMP-binding protein [Oscillospiraceae bacterium]